MSVKNARKLIAGMTITGAALMLLSGGETILFTIGVIVACGSLIPHFLFNRCPCCGKNLGKSGGDYCPFCGSRLDGK